MSYTVNWNSRCVRKQNVFTFTLTLMRCDSISRIRLFAVVFGSAETSQMFCAIRVRKIWLLLFQGVTRHMENDFNLPFSSLYHNLYFFFRFFYNRTSVSLLIILFSNSANSAKFFRFSISSYCYVRLKLVGWVFNLIYLLLICYANRISRLGCSRSLSLFVDIFYCVYSQSIHVRIRAHKLCVQHDKINPNATNNLKRLWKLFVFVWRV